MKITLDLLPEEAEAAAAELEAWLLAALPTRPHAARALLYIHATLAHNAAFRDAEVARRAGERRLFTKRVQDEAHCLDCRATLGPDGGCPNPDCPTHLGGPQ